MDYRDQSRVLVVFGIPLLLIGMGSALLGPAEMYCFHLFSEGGRFHYEGFGFGSFMFGNIASQIIGYYLIAMLLIPLGYGHLKIRRWARTLSLTLLWSWLVVGVPLVIAFFLVLVTSKEPSPAAVLIAVIFLASSYLVIPGLLIRFYHSRNVRLTFENRDPRSYWVDRLPIPILVLCSLYLFYSIVLHIPIFFNGLFPLFGVFLSDLEGVLLLDVSIMVLVFLIWGTLRLRIWAWWGALVYFGLATFSSISTLLGSSYLDILSAMGLPPREMELLDQVPAQGFHFAVLIGMPLLLTIAAIVLSRRHFGARHPVLHQ
jgi:MFS family permease